MNLEQIDTGIWPVEGRIVNFYGFPYPTRSVIVRLPDGNLGVWSPVAFTDGLREEVVDLGPVAHLISPNKLHHLHLGEWQAAYPGAALWGPPSTRAKHKELGFPGTLGATTPPTWAGVIDPWHLRLSPFFEEIVLSHNLTPRKCLGYLAPIQAFFKGLGKDVQIRFA